jgi:hypothetical protein
MKPPLAFASAGLFLTATAVTVAAVSMTASRQAQATVAFAQQTGRPCGQCHVGPSGVGPLKPFGQKFKDNGNRLPPK